MKGVLVIAYAYIVNAYLSVQHAEIFKWNSIKSMENVLI